MLFRSMKWPKYWSFSFSISSSKEHPGLISFSMDWLDLLAVQGTLKSLLQNHSSKAAIHRRSAFFTVQLSHPYMTTGKTKRLIKRLFGSFSKPRPKQRLEKQESLLMKAKEESEKAGLKLNIQKTMIMVSGPIT